MKVLDLFCGAGGAAMGLHRAWPDAEITGVDIKPQPRYPFNFIQADAMTFPLGGFDFIWASPVCKRYSATARLHPGVEWPDQVPGILERMRSQPSAWVVENVPGAPLARDFMLCGRMFGLRLYRHRYFESSEPLTQPSHPHHDARTTHGHRPQPGEVVTVTGHFSDFHAGELAMDIDWMVRDELTQAVPPAYSEFIARQILIDRPKELVA